MLWYAYDAVVWWMHWFIDWGGKLGHDTWNKVTKTQTLVLVHQKSCQTMRIEYPYIIMPYGIFPLG